MLQSNQHNHEFTLSTLVGKLARYSNGFSILMLFMFSATVPIHGQESPILASQKVAIRTLALQHGFSERQLEYYLTLELGQSIEQLTSREGASVIRAFQSNNPPVPQTPPVALSRRPRSNPVPVSRQPEPVQNDPPIIASILEVGMAKRFHLIDGNIINGVIISITDGIAQIETIDGLLQVPSDVILEETAEIQKKDDTRYVGPVLRDTPEEIVLRSLYGDVVISKRDIKKMDRYYGGRKVAWAEEKKRFYQGEAALTDIFLDPTAFPLPANTFYVSGLSIGYAFTDRFMVRSAYGSDFSGDLNLHPVLRFYHRQTGSSEVASAVGFHMFNHHPIRTVGSKYANQILVGDQDGLRLSETDLLMSDAMEKSNKFYWEAYLVLSSRRSLASNRGKLGWHLGLKTNSLGFDRPELRAGYVWDKNFIPYRAWGGFEYDLSKRMKLIMEMWADNGHKFRSLKDAAEDYFGDSTPFIFDAAGGEYRPVDFDFGLLYALKDNLRLGLHFQEPYFTIYWEFYEL